jgi:hypothetical protein
MPSYEVTMHRIEQHTFTVEADTPEEADYKANDEVRVNGVSDNGYANWETVSVEEVAPAPQFVPGAVVPIPNMGGTA